MKDKERIAALLHHTLELLDLIDEREKDIEFRMYRRKKDTWLNPRAVHIFSLYPKMFKNIDKDGVLLARAHEEYL